MSNTVNQQVEIEVEEQALTPIIAESELSKFGRRTKLAIASTVVALEVNPITNEGSRFGAMGIAIAESHNPLVGAAVLGGTTLAVEGAGAIAASTLLAQDNTSRIFTWVNKRASKIVTTEGKISPLTESGVALTLGTPILLGLKQTEDPARTLEQNRKHGLLVASGLAGVFAIEGALISEGVHDYTDIKKVGAAVLGLAGLHFGATKLRHHRSKTKGTDNVI